MSESEITGSLQAKIMMTLRDKKLCGVDLMSQLRIKSPGTMYPVLELLRKKGLIDFKVEINGAVRKKTYFLTDFGEQEIRDHLTRSAKFCCDISKYLAKILENAGGLVEIKRHQKVLSTLDYDVVRRFLKAGDVTFSNDLKVPADSYDVALSFLGVGILIGQERADAADYVKQLYRLLKKGGKLLIIEIEKTDNIFSEILLEDFLGVGETPGLHSEDLKSILIKNGFTTKEIISRRGLLYAVALKP